MSSGRSAFGSKAADIRDLCFPPAPKRTMWHFIRRKKNAAKSNAFRLNIPALTLRRGWATGVFGVSGSGKTTLFDVLAGLRASSESRRRVRPVFPSIGYLMHGSSLLPWLTVAQNVSIEERLRGIDIDRNYFFALLDELQLDAVKDKKGFELSFGMQQRVELAIVLAAKVDLLIMDEGLSGLNQQAKLAAAALIRRQIDGSGMSCIFTSHFPPDVFRLADSVVIIREGRLGPELPVGSPSQSRVLLTDKELFEKKECVALLDEFYR